ncbi:malate synthase G [Lutimaribacter sp. EGI FJ00015]|uniref:Malate synthase G n=1 Tax=Lutimaribacter degradans TaxID=2945989 RepID=A0ACC5ZRN1_9RHOB|nr:malate synthase G [Lutimaribacter sp. EGI FJ00013]MCM2560815.1 malate synthase G [Lutimaribacter sp. EGI FJ00013]MCO0612240.1 malate synthase G [Lutimaribacter sp. EGI FJ00015]MCO0634640.1 malate synthase G [Lutimaribacter sp. EGI FJ00014]
MTQRIEKHGLQVARELASFIDDQALPGIGVSADAFWKGLSDIAHGQGRENARLLEKRAEIQGQIDTWHKARMNEPRDPDTYRAFLRDIGYLVEEGDDFQIDTANVDPEIAKVAGPQLVVPITNARFALNAANARWGSLYDCFYGTDVMGAPVPSGGYDKGRGARVVARARVFLDQAFPITGGSHADARRYHVEKGALLVDDMPLADPSKFVGYRGHPKAPAAVLLINNGLHVELVFDRTHPIGSRDQAGLADMRMESALSAIMDCEDSVACVDAEDKVAAYANWLGLMKGDLEETFQKGGQQMTRRLADDPVFTTPDGQGQISLKGRALMLVRNVGHLMTNPAILTRDGDEVYEGLMDAMVTTLIAMHDLARDGGNSVTGSVYVVKPKMHGPEEVAFAVETFDMVEDALGLPRNTVKLGIMDEERRTSANLKECIRAARSRVCFINTGFLDRTGDEIHTSMEAGPFSRKDFIKRKAWIGAYENLNVDIGLECGLQGRAQIGKGMWAKPDAMAEMLDQKIEHPKSGATCAWVPSPTAATLHALHYHQVDVFAVQDKLKAGGRRAHLDMLLDIPLASYRKWTDAQIMREVENNAQGILGYVVRWVDQGIGCSKVPDINDEGLMEDRATCRISSQHIANWLHHGVVSRERVMEAMQKMARVVDGQNADDPAYRPMGPGFDGIAFKAACDLVFEGRVQPSGYTEPVLHRRRLELKAAG